MTEDKPEGYKMNAMTGIGAIVVIIAFIPVFSGGGLAPLPLVIGILLLIGGAIVHAVKAKK